MTFVEFVSFGVELCHLVAVLYPLLVVLCHIMLIVAFSVDCVI